MAVLTSDQLAELRRAVQADGGAVVNFDKPAFNAALQAIEDWFEANRTALGAAIPGGFNAAQKKRLVTVWLLQKFNRGG